MANPSVTTSNLRLEDMEGLVTNVIDIGQGTGATEDIDFVLQGLQSWGRRISNTGIDHGFWAPFVATDMTTGDNKVWMCKVLLTNKEKITAGAVVGGMKVRIGSDNFNYKGYIIADDGTLGDNKDLRYPIKGGWIVEPIDPNVSAWIDADVGTTILTAVTQVAVTGNVSDTSGAENLFMDAVDVGGGLWVVGGDGASPNASITDFTDLDKLQATAGRFGHAFDVEGTFVMYGMFVIGSTSAGTVQETDFTENDSTIVFPGGRVAPGWNGFTVKINGFNATGSVIKFTNVTTQGRGRNNLKLWFSTANEVDAVTDEIDFPQTHRMNTGDAVIYSKEGGAQAIGLTDATEYFVQKITDTAFKIHTTRLGALTAGTAVVLTASVAASSEQHSLTRQPDTRPDFLTSGNTGKLVVTNTSFQNYRNLTFNDATTVTGCRFLDCNNINLSNALLDTISECSILRHSTQEGVALVTLPNPSALKNCTFDIGGGLIGIQQGHALNATVAGTYAITGNKFLNYGPTEAVFNASTDVNATLDEITVGAAFYSGIVNGDAVYYNTRGGTAIVGLVDGARYYARISDTTANTVALYRTRDDSLNNTQRIALTAGVSQTHCMSSARAAFVNSSGGTVTLNVLAGGDLPSYRTVGLGTTVVSSAVTIEVTGVTEGTRVSMYATDNNALLLNDLAYTSDGAGAFKASAAFSYLADRGVTVQSRSSGKAVGAVLDDGGAKTDMIVESNDVADNITLVPTTAVVGDYFAWGHPDKFDKMVLTFGTFGSGYTLAWEYWNGTAWTAITTISDGTSNYTQNGFITWTIPGDWATSTFVGIIRGAGPYYWIRARVATVTTPVQAIGRKVTLDVQKYLPFDLTNTIVNTGLSVKATWFPDSVSTFPTTF